MEFRAGLSGFEIHPILHLQEWDGLDTPDSAKGKGFSVRYVHARW